MILTETRSEIIGSWKDEYGFVTDVIEITKFRRSKIDIDGNGLFNVDIMVDTWKPVPGEEMTCKIISMLDTAFLGEVEPWLKIVVNDPVPGGYSYNDRVDVIITDVGKHKQSVYISARIKDEL